MADSTETEITTYKFPNYSVPLLTGKINYRAWCIKIKYYLGSCTPSLWNFDKGKPIFLFQSAGIICQFLSDDLLIATSDINDKCELLWKYFSDLYHCQDLTAKSIAIQNLSTFSYDQSTMPMNHSKIKSLINDVTLAFGINATIPISELGVVFAMVNLPSKYQSVRISLQSQY